MYLGKLLGINLIMITLLIVACGNKSNNNVSQTNQNIIQIAYNTYSDWSISNVLFGKIIVINEKFNNEKDLKSLGDTLNYNLKDYKEALVFIFDDANAAKLQEEMRNKPDLELDKADEAYYNKHYLGVYNKNSTTGMNEINIKISGDFSNIKY
jgi:hypothetical protein